MLTIITRSFAKIRQLQQTVRYLEKAGCGGREKPDFKIELTSADEFDWCENSFDENRRKRRPISPCLSIYEPQITSVMSITHRITGLVTTGYFTMFGLAPYFLKNNMSDTIEMMEESGISSLTLCACKFIVAFPFAYHFSTGIRHIIWDTGRFLTISGVYKTGYAALVAAIAGTIFLCAL